MRKAATILVLGDPGPLRDELVLRKEIDVVWAESFEDATLFLKCYSVEACIISPCFEAMPNYAKFRRQMGMVPCLVCRTRVCGHPTDSEPTECVLSFLARHTGLVFARFPRAPLRVPLTLEAQGTQYQLETTNVSVSGLGIRGFPNLEIGIRAELCLELPQTTLYLLGRVVRVFDISGERHAGLSFTDVMEPARRALSLAVEEALPDDDAMPRLFGELEVPFPTVHQDSAHGLEPNVEVDARAWTQRVLSLRMAVARARSEDTDEVPALRDAAYQRFCSVDKEPEPVWEAPVPGARKP